MAIRSIILALVCFGCVVFVAHAQRDTEAEKKKEDDPNQAHLSYGNTPLHDAARDGDMKMLQGILDRVPGIFRDRRFVKLDYHDPEDYPDTHEKNDGGNTPLHLAAYMGQTPAVRLLLEKGASVHATNRAGNTALHWAARHEDTAILAMLLDKGSDARAEDKSGFTGLHFCAYANAVETCRLLLDNGADVNAVTDKGYTPVCTAAEHHCTAVAELLIERGADVTNVEDHNGNGPLDLCSGRAATIKYDGLPHQTRSKWWKCSETMELGMRRSARKRRG
eukprot:CAMPEP_0181310138 /NCGR_PEP_ID=MMETSP1101-20121128/12421_1 /TAXON_ID=46948 /ORGANISM="Rhodomonas abbreviata, Strain Caron Lab Isolate" /LENGTH=277 /DNA_ID=CAMNT_0023416737 /DNA_START=117 /DNA_END=946 /DNA_ORIENTATION=+